MKKVLLYYNFSYPAGGGDYLPLFFAAELMKSCEVTLAVDMKSGFEKSCAFFCMESALSGLRVEQLMPDDYTLAGHSFLDSWHRSRRLKQLARQADICISTCNIIDFGKPAHHFINVITFGNDGFADYVCHRSIPTRTRIRRAFVETVLRSLSGIRSKRAIIRDPREHIYPNSKYVSRLMQEFYGQFKATLFYPPTTFTIEGKNAPARDPLKVVYIGRINPNKGIVDIIGIVEHARTDTGLELTLHLAGPQDQGEFGLFIRKHVEDKPWVKFIGPVYGEKKEAFLQSGTYAIHSERDEAFGISITEYLKAGCIPIVPDEGGTVEIVDNPELTYHTNEAAAQILSRLVQDKEFRSKQLARCTERAEAFTMGFYTENQRRILERILAGTSEQAAQ